MRRVVPLLVVAALVALLVLLASWLLRDDPSDRPDATSAADAAAGARPSNAPSPRTPRPRAGPSVRSDVAADPDAADDSSGAISGRVIDGRGAPVVGAIVRAAPRPESVLLDRMRVHAEIDTSYPQAFEAETRTGDDGTFALRGRSDRRWIVVAESERAASDAVVVEPGDAADLELVLVAASTFAVPVVSGAGAPIPGAVALVYDAKYAGAPHARFVADAAGTLHLRCIDDEPMLVSAPGFATARVLARFDLPEIVLLPGLSIAGRVEASDGAPVAGAVVVLNHPGTLAEAVLSDTKGDFRFDGLNGAEGVRGFTFSVEAEAFPRVWRTLWAGDTEARIVLRRPGSVEGVVVGADGRPAAGLRVRCATDETNSAADGGFSFPEIGAGATFVWIEMTAAGLAEGRTLAVGRTPVQVEEGAVTRVRVVAGAPPVSYLTVTVTRATSGDIEPSRVVVATPDGEEHESYAEAEPARFTLPWPAGTSVRVRATSLRRNCPEAQAELPTTAAATAPARILALPASVTVTVRVRDETDAERTEGLWVYVRSSGDTSWLDGDEPAELDPDRRAEARVSAPGYPTAFYDLDPPGPAGRTYDVRLVRGGKVRGRLIDADGAPHRLFAVRLGGRADVEPAEPWGRGRFSNGSDDADDGSFALEDVPAGPFSLVFVRGHGVRPGETIGVAAGRVDPGGTCDVGPIVAWSPVALTGRIIGPGDRPVGGAVVTVRGDGATFGAEAVADADGRFSVRVLSGPRLVVEVARPGVGGAARAIGVVTDATAPLDLRLGRGGSARVRFADPYWAARGEIRAAVGAGPSFIPPGGERGLSPVADRTIEGLPDGPVRLTLDVPGEEPTVREVTIRAGTATDVSFDREP